MFGGRNLEREIKEKENFQKQLSKHSSSSSGVAFGVLGDDDPFYSKSNAHVIKEEANKSEDTTTKNTIKENDEKLFKSLNFKGFSSHGSSTEKKYDSDSDEDGKPKTWASKFNIAQRYLKESAEMMEKDAEDPFASYTKKNRIAEQENDYQKRWRTQMLRPTGYIDPLTASLNKSKKKQGKEEDNQEPEVLSYSHILEEKKIEREKQELLFKIKKAQQENERLESVKKRNEELEKVLGKRKVEEDKNDEKNEEDSYKRGFGRNSKRPKWGKEDEEKKKEDEMDEERKYKEELVKKGLKELPDFKPSGKLAEESNVTKTGALLKWQMPEEAILPKKNWRLYVYKNGEQISKPLIITGQKAFLFGRDRDIVDIPTDHSSCSKQHAVVCFRKVTKFDEKKQKNRTKKKPYLLDIESTNGTHLNKKKIESGRYYELRNSDLIQFGESQREYILIEEDKM